jgi:hypothetical protein
MKATKTWHCECCGEAINPGEEMRIIAGDFFKEGHSMENPRNTEREAIQEQKIQDTAFGKNLFAQIIASGQRKKITTEQTELLPDAKRAWNKYQRELPEQEPLEDLPLFNAEYQKTEQLSLF